MNKAFVIAAALCMLAAGSNVCGAFAPASYMTASAAETASGTCGKSLTWTFSSGPLDEAWVSWYIHEFLMASWVWIDINNMWIPCNVLPEEQVTLVQHDKTDMLEVMLALKLDINGSPM